MQTLNLSSGRIQEELPQFDDLSAINTSVINAQSTKKSKPLSTSGSPLQPAPTNQEKVSSGLEKSSS
jgi:hypothetical protein